jgi:hypothetical protein
MNGKEQQLERRYELITSACRTVWNNGGNGATSQSVSGQPSRFHRTHMEARENRWHKR